ncbi:MAG TPA: hypothetical protein EYP41_08955 [Anaerolineae bacterium]|nr:hypothetical protein [Anaerolineae bacterium]
MDSAKFVSFSSDQDLDQVPAGEVFTAVWRVRNIGSTTWGDGYNVVHIHADEGSTLMTEKAGYPLPEVASLSSVRPGDEVEISLKMTAPAPRSKRYFTDWQLQNPAGELFGEVIWLRVVTTKPKDTPPPSGLRESNSQYIDDDTIPDGTPLEEGAAFVKNWAVKNTGKRKWGKAYRLVFVNGDREMSGSMTHTVPLAAPGEEVILSIPMTAPPARNEPYISSWRLHDDRNVPFGDHFWVKIFSTARIDGFGIQPYSQNDPRWKNNILGTGPRTMSEFGCLVSSFAMMLSAYGENITPWELDQKLLQMPPGQGFDGSNVFFAAPAFLIGHIKFHGNWKPRPETGATFAQFDPNLIARIDQELQNGQAVLVQVDRNPTNPYNISVEQHWVYVLGRQGEDYLILDPIDGRPVSLLSKYGAQTRAQSSEEALKQAIKSALIYRSSRAKVRVSVQEPDEAVDESGASDIGPTGELVYTGPAWSFNRCLKGVHDRANRHPLQADYDIVNGRFETVKVMSGITTEELKKYQVPFFMCRLFESWNGRHVPVEDFVNTVANDIGRLVDAGVEYFEFHNEPNLTHEGLMAEGVKGSWRNGAEFAQYFIRGRKLLKARFPGIKVGFPGLSPGPDAKYQFGQDKGFRMNDRDFLEGAKLAARAADFLCVHAYYISMKEVRTEAIELVKRYRRRFPGKLIFVSEFSNPNPQKKFPAAEMGRQAKEFYRLCNEIPGVGAAYYFIVSGSGWDHQALRRDADGRSLGMVETMF